MKIYQELEKVPGTEEKKEQPGPSPGKAAKLPLLIMAAAAAVLIWLPLSKSIIVRGIPLGDSFRIRCCEPNWDANQFIRKGASMDEAAYTWTDGKELVFYPLNAPEEGDWLMTVRTAGIFSGSQRVSAVLNGETVYEDSLEGPGDLEIRLRLKKGKNDLRIGLPDAVSPTRLKVGNDTRELALQLTDISLQRQ